MTEIAERLKTELSGLPAEVRAELAWYLMDTLSSSIDPQSEAAWIAELDRRCDQVESGTIVPRPFEEVINRLRKRRTNE